MKEYGKVIQAAQPHGKASFLDELADAEAVADHHHAHKLAPRVGSKERPRWNHGRLAFPQHSPLGLPLDLELERALHGADAVVRRGEAQVSTEEGPVWVAGRRLHGGNGEFPVALWRGDEWP